jgi:AraC-like DNA-binding protein
VSKHIFPTPVRNVLIADGVVHVKTGDGMYKLTGSEWDKQKINFKKNYVFFEKDFYEADFRPLQYVFDASSMAYLIPQKSITNGTKVQVDDRLFVSVGGALFEYQINMHYTHSYLDHSIRDIYIDDELKVVSTYDGIFLNDTLKASYPSHSNGPFTKIRTYYYLCSDQLFRFIPPDNFHRIESAVNVFSGYSRKLAEFRNQLISLNTKSINWLDSGYQLTPIQQGYEYYDMEVYGSELLFCTRSGELFAFDGSSVRQICKLRTRIRDIYIFKNIIYLSSDEGVFYLKGINTDPPIKLTNTPFTVMVVVDPLRNTWIATENGLFLLPENSKEPILFIKDVEFNRGALTYYNDHIYAGSISGLYSIDVYLALRNFLPPYLDKKNLQVREKQSKWLVAIMGVLFSSVIFILTFRHYRKRKSSIVLPRKEQSPALSLQAITETIRNHNIMTVDALAEHYKTNTVQLNRQFKVFNTTPGKFMKKVKLEYARELLEGQVPMDVVVGRVGYTANFIRKELKSAKSGQKQQN